jgi:hypothetical protein
MTDRYAHLVGSVPAPNAVEAMQLAAGRLGTALKYLPDGETGDRRNWVLNIIESFRDHPEVRVVKDGGWTSYDDMPRFGVRPGHRLYGAAVDLGIAKAAADARSEFEALRPQLAEGASFQVGIPGDLDLALFTFGPAGPVRYRRPFTEALGAAMHEVHGQFGADAIFQLEVPAELVLLARAPAPARRGLAAMLGRGIGRLAQAAPPGARFGVHLCLGDMNHEALGRVTDTGPLTLLSNAIVRRWPGERTLEFIHLPLAAADDPPSTDASFYAPLAGLRLGSGMRLVAGFAHEDQDPATQFRVRRLIEDAVGRPVDVSTSCGLGRRDPTAAIAAIERVKLLLSDENAAVIG